MSDCSDCFRPAPAPRPRTPRPWRVRGGQGRPVPIAPGARRDPRSRCAHGAASRLRRGSLREREAAMNRHNAGGEGVFGVAEDDQHCADRCLNRRDAPGRNRWRRRSELEAFAVAPAASAPPRKPTAPSPAPPKQCCQWRVRNTAGHSRGSEDRLLPRSTMRVPRREPAQTAVVLGGERPGSAG